MVCPPPFGDDGDAEKTTVIGDDEETLNRELQQAREQDACLIVIRGKPQGHRFFITLPSMVIGRDPSAQISVPDPSVSRQHARVITEGDVYKIEDLGSANGTVINGKKIATGSTVALAKEDMIKLGNSILKFLPKGELEILFYGNLGNAAYTDPLTKIYNKGYLAEALDAEFKRAKALHQEFSLVFFDIDHFKQVNDTYGHDAGDYVLKELASLIKKNFVAEKEVFARYGGEEFVILLSNTAIAPAMKKAEAIRSAVEMKKFVYEKKELPIRVSLGVAQMTKDEPRPESLLKRADKALYQSKESGRNRVTQAD